MNEKDEIINEIKVNDLLEKLSKFKKYLPDNVSYIQLKKLDKIVAGFMKSEEDKILKGEVKRIIENDAVKTTSFLKDVPDLQNDLTKLPKQTKISFRERIIDGILNISISNYLTYSPLGLQQYVGVDVKKIKIWLKETDEDLPKGEEKTVDLWKMLKYKFEFNQGKAIAKENIKNFNINPNMFDFNLGASILSDDDTYENNKIPFDKYTIEKQKETKNEWDEFEKHSDVENKKELDEK